LLLQQQRLLWEVAEVLLPWLLLVALLLLRGQGLQVEAVMLQEEVAA
jgi:hypothetical protein